MKKKRCAGVIFLLRLFVSEAYLTLNAVNVHGDLIVGKYVHLLHLGDLGTKSSVTRT